MDAPECPRCFTRETRLSRKRAPLLARAVGVHAFRCRSCGHRFLAWRLWMLPRRSADD